MKRRNVHAAISNPDISPFQYPISRILNVVVANIPHFSSLHYVAVPWDCHNDNSVWSLRQSGSPLVKKEEFASKIEITLNTETNSSPWHPSSSPRDFRLSIGCLSFPCALMEYIVVLLQLFPTSAGWGHYIWSQTVLGPDLRQLTTQI